MRRREGLPVEEGLPSLVPVGGAKEGIVNFRIAVAERVPRSIMSLAVWVPVG